MVESHPESRPRPRTARHAKEAPVAQARLSSSTSTMAPQTQNGPRVSPSGLPARQQSACGSALPHRSPAVPLAGAGGAVPTHRPPSDGSSQAIHRAKSPTAPEGGGEDPGSKHLSGFRSPRSKLRDRLSPAACNANHLIPEIAHLFWRSQVV